MSHASGASQGSTLGLPPADRTEEWTVGSGSGSSESSGSPSPVLLDLSSPATSIASDTPSVRDLVERWEKEAIVIAREVAAGGKPVADAWGTELVGELELMLDRLRQVAAAQFAAAGPAARRAASHPPRCSSINFDECEAVEVGAARCCCVRCSEAKQAC